MKNEILKIDKELPTVKKTELPSGHPLNDLTCRMLIAEAIKAREKAYAPYSGFKVGAALMSAGKKIITGCNIENSAFSPTICAERVAFSKAISDGVLESDKSFVGIAVVGGKDANVSKEKGFAGKGWNVAGAELVGKAFAERLVKAKLADNCYFDRGGYRYHGRVKALCEAIRAGGVRI